MQLFYLLQLENASRLLLYNNIVFETILHVKQWLSQDRNNSHALCKIYYKTKLYDVVLFSSLLLSE